MRRVVVLPLPLGPRKPVTRPGSTSKSRWSTAENEQNRFVRPRTSMCPVNSGRPCTTVLPPSAQVGATAPAVMRPTQPHRVPGPRGGRSERSAAPRTGAPPYSWAHHDLPPRPGSGHPRHQPGHPSRHRGRPRTGGPAVTEWLLVLGAVLLTAGTALFVAAEFSLVALDRPTVQRAIDEGDSRARVVLQSLKQLSTQLSAAQVGITLTTLVVGYLAQPSIGVLLAGPLEGLGLGPGMVDALSSALALLLATTFSMVFGELLPQFLGISAPLPTAKVVALPVRVFAVVAKPLIIVLNGSANAFLRALGIEPQQELSCLVQRSADAGTLYVTTARILTRSLVFGERTADDVMTPRVRCTVV